MNDKQLQRLLDRIAWLTFVVGVNIALAGFAIGMSISLHK